MVLEQFSLRNLQLWSNSGGYAPIESNDTLSDFPHPPSRRALLRRNWVRSRVRCPKRLGYILLLPVPLLLLWVILSAIINGVPPLYAEIRTLESEISQRNAPIESPQKYIRFPGRITKLGVNNYLQEIFFMAHIAFLSNRSFVYDDYVWSWTPSPYVMEGFRLIPSRLPLHAIVSGSVSGGPVPGHPNALKAISAKWWDTVCPPSKRTVINPPGAPPSGEGNLELEFWTTLLREIPDSCVEVDERRQPIFHEYLFASRRLLSAWPSLQDSPVLKGKSWSPLVLAALSRNIPYIITPGVGADATADMSHLLAMHVRRGDFAGHCKWLHRHNSRYVWIAQHEDIPDRFDPSQIPEADRLEYYLEHCWVQDEDIVRKAREVREAFNGRLRTVYLMTNGDADWVNSIKNELLADGWEDVKSSKDLILDRWERYVDGVVDMAIAEKAGAFIGNGFSSLTANVVMFRALGGQPMDTNRFW